METYGVVNGQPILACERVGKWRLMVYRYKGQELVYRAEQQASNGRFSHQAADLIPTSVAKRGSELVKEVAHAIAL